MRRAEVDTDRVDAVRRWIERVPRENLTDPSAHVQWDDSAACIAALRCLGNAVVQQQGELALRMLMEVA